MPAITLPSRAVGSSPKGVEVVAPLPPPTSLCLHGSAGHSWRAKPKGGANPRHTASKQSNRARPFHDHLCPIRRRQPCWRVTPRPSLAAGCTFTLKLNFKLAKEKQEDTTTTRRREQRNGNSKATSHTVQALPHREFKGPTSPRTPRPDSSTAHRQFKGQLH